MLIQSDIGLVSMLQNTGTISRIVLVCSAGSVGLVLGRHPRKSPSSSGRFVARVDTFWRIFRKAKNLSEIGTACETLRFTPLVAVFNSGAPYAAKKSSNTNALQRVMQRAATAQLSRLESRLTFLATTASAAPFIGLVRYRRWRLDVVPDLSNAESASLKAVGPGIAEALLATAFGLFAAIPAVVAYNQFVYRLRNIGGQLDDLQVEMLNIAEDDE